MIEAVSAVLLKAAFPIAGSAWAVTICEGEWWLAVIILPPLLFVAVYAVRYSARQRGKHGPQGIP